MSERSWGRRERRHLPSTCSRKKQIVPIVVKAIDAYIAASRFGRESTLTSTRDAQIKMKKARKEVTFRGCGEETGESLTALAFCGEEEREEEPPVTSHVPGVHQKRDDFFEYGDDS